VRQAVACLLTLVADWIASTSDGKLRQVELQADGSLVLVSAATLQSQTAADAALPAGRGCGEDLPRERGRTNSADISLLQTGYPMDNLRTDSNGHVWAASFPKLLKLLPREWRSTSARDVHR